MTKKIMLGTDIFEKLIRSNGYYIDKTELLYELVEETSNEVTLFTRPRRFGKTLTMSMMEFFLDMNGYNTVLCYGISFFEKSAKVKLKRS